MSGNLRARGTKPRRSGGESIPLQPLGRMVALSRAGDARGTVGRGPTALENSHPVVRTCFARAVARRPHRCVVMHMGICNMQFEGRQMAGGVTLVGHTPFKQKTRKAATLLRSLLAAAARAPPRPPPAAACRKQPQRMPLDMGAWPLTPSPTMWIMPLRARRRFASLASERHRQTGDALSALAEVSLHVAGAHAAHVRPGGLW